MAYSLIDVHAHLQFPHFNNDRSQAIKRALDLNIGVINAGANKDSSEKAVELSRQYSSGVWATVGQHPTENENFDCAFYKNLALNPKVAAIGECGLDFYRIKNEELRIKNLQKEIFIEHIKLAQEVGKPLMIHCRARRDFGPAKQNSREAFKDLIGILNSAFLIHNSDCGGVIHFFTGTLDDAKKLLDMNFYFTFGGLITFNRNFDEIIRFIPLKKILLETDAPYVAPEPYRGKRNEPIYVVEVAKKIAEIKNVSYKKVAEQTTANAIDIFQLKI